MTELRLTNEQQIAADEAAVAAFQRQREPQTLSEASAAFNEASAQRVVVELDNGFTVDAESGEIIVAPRLGADVSMLEYLQAQQFDADQQKKRWDEIDRTLRMMIFRLMRNGDEWKHAGPQYVSSWHSGGSLRAANIATEAKALEDKKIGVEETVLLRARAVKDYDPKLIDALVAEELLTQSQADALITVTPRAGHVETKVAPKVAPKATRRIVSVAS